jgi:chemotaxis protein histidine kinase CheA
MPLTETQYKDLDPDEIGATVTRLGKRINERFPDSGLAALCEELRVVSTVAKERSERFKKPIIALRLGSAVLVLMIILGVLSTGLSIKTTGTHFSISEFIQLLEAAINDLVLIGAGLFFLITFETRIKRNRALDALHELRSFAHIIDMHQLTKDMTRMEETPSSPHRPMTPAQLLRYLDYCSEMLSLVGKVAALYVQHFNDSGALAAVTEVENLTTGLSRKIWQKITLIEKHMPMQAYVKHEEAPLPTEPEAEPEPEPEPEPEAESEPEPEPEPEAEPEPEPEPEAESEPEAEPEPEPEPEAESETKAQGK